MFSSLHQLLFSKQENTILAYDANGDKTIADLKKEVATVQYLCSSLEAERYVIACCDPWFHLVALLAVQQMGKTAVFPHNQASSTLKEYQNDAVLLSDQLNFQPDVVLTGEQSYPEIDTYLPLKVCALTCKIELFTSGSTAKPKRIVKSLAVFELEAEVLQKQFLSMSAVTRIVGTVAHFHIYGFLFRIVWPLLSQRCFDRRLASNTELLSAIVSKETALIASPVMLEHLSLEDSTLITGQVFSSGGPLKYETALAVLKRVGHLPIEVFGSSETGGIAWRTQEQVVTPWQLFEGISYTENDGQLVINSPFIDQGADFYTDDAIKSVDERHFQLLGRRDRVIKLAEKRISLSAIERSVMMLDEVSAAIVLVSESDKRKVINLAITLSDTSYQTTSQSGGYWWKKIRQHLVKDTESVALPRKVRIIDAIPRNSQGKIDNHKLQELFI
ncbi:hypothetical protein BCU68_03615 [Vibrio sp. 10N.286.49.B3]|uniref:AMP-binding protein n=1 Tax=Vibrio sp. 10N.286.49.B3 TaxID=1880855 RepID=UPI000C81D6EB|nr:AMP-binding protein [Vibrio sp. 10N.286.49.B3]PMH44598.1 hypothetical protein BCU68_03615 [Vibrio sp. 10N.286.49.B3]